MLRRFLTPSTVVFAAIILLVVVWIGSGMLGREPVQTTPGVAPARVVAASWSEAGPVKRRLSFYGEIEPVEIAILRARTAGIVEDVPRQGRRVVQGEVLAQLSKDDREARIARGQAQMAAAQRNYAAALQLAERNAAPQAEVPMRLAELEAARAELRSAELDMAHTSLSAPISGIVNRVIAEVGAFVPAGGEVLEIVDNDPLIARVQVQQSEIANVTVGQSARVRLIGSREMVGHVSFVSPLADAATRTFRAEVELANPGADIPAGTSAEVVLTTGTSLAHHVSPALLRLDTEGRLGLFAIEGDDRIAFRPVEIVTADATGVFIGGLADRERLVTISHGDVVAGQVVTVEETPAAYLVQVLPAAAARDEG